MNCLLIQSSCLYQHLCISFTLLIGSFWYKEQTISSNHVMTMSPCQRDHRIQAVSPWFMITSPANERFTARPYLNFACLGVDILLSLSFTLQKPCLPPQEDVLCVISSVSKVIHQVNQHFYLSNAYHSYLSCHWFLYGTLGGVSGKATLDDKWQSKQ